jgi:hypothetical protein
MSNQPFQFPKPPDAPPASDALRGPASPGVPDGAAAPPTSTESAPATATAAPPSVAVGVPPRRPSRVVVGVVCGLVGAVIGYAAGTAGTTARADAPVPAALTVERSAPTASAAAKSAKEPRRPAAATSGVAEIGVDMGSPDRRLELTGPWSDVQLGARSAARLGFTASLTTHLAPTGDPYGLAVVARVDEGVLDIGVRVNQRDVGRWRVSKDWDMHAVVLDSNALRSGANTVEFVLPSGPGEKAVAMVIDTLHLGPLQMRAHADLSGAHPNGSLIDGYYGREGQGEEALTWSAGKQTRVGLLLKPLNAEYEVELRGAAFGPLQPLGVEAKVNGTSIGKVKVDKDAAYDFRVPAGTLSAGFNEVTFVYEKTLKPSEMDSKSKDQRELALRISRVTLKPRATQ